MFLKGAVCVATILTVLLILDSTDAQKGQQKKGVPALSRGIEQFSFSFLLRTALKAHNRNVIVSPFSVWTMLTVLAEGANGNTEKELKYALRIPLGGNGKNLLRSNFQTFAEAFNIKTNTVELESTSFLYTDKTVKIRPDYKSLISSTYLTNVNEVEFQNGRKTADDINNSVKQATRGKINQIVYPDDMENAKMILINAIFFHGQWTMPFNSSLTTLETFYDENNRGLGQVNMMYQRGPYPYISSPDFKAQIVEIPYGKEDRLSMIVFIPKNGVKLGEVFDRFLTVPVSQLFESLGSAAEEYADDEIELLFPRFSVSSDINLNVVLNEMGIYEPFDPHYANFSELSASNNLYLSKVIHKAQIEVTEEGTVASAVTAGELSNRGKFPKVVANKPFLYIIVEKTTNIVVLGGTYVTPQLF